jgi:hypothetical protein
MEDTDRQTAPPASQPLAPDTVLAEQLTRCHKAIAECFECTDDTKFSFSAQIESLNAAERLIRVSIALAAALGKSGREFTHRIIVERPAPMIDVTPECAKYPPPPMKKSKTIHGGRKPEVRNIG